MMALQSQRDVMSAFKKETCSNVSILSKFHALPGDLARQIFKENALEKPTQSVFLHLSHYLVCIVNPQIAAALPWPLYDSADEKKYRGDFSSFVLEYSKLGFLTPVMSSYFVNPACSKVTKLMFQLSQLALEVALIAKMVSEQQIALYDDVSEKYVSNCRDFLENSEKETNIMIGKFYTYKQKKETVEQLAEMLRERIKKNEAKQIEKQGLLKDLVKSFIKKNEFEADLVTKIKLIKDPNQPVPFFDLWLEQTDNEIDLLVSKWEANTGSFKELVKSCKSTTECLIAKHTSEMDRKAYILEYDPKTDKINTKDLEAQVNTEQKYILKNIIKENQLNFPNLIRSYVISICFILKNTQVSDDIFKFNEYLEIEKRNYKEISTALGILLNRIMNADEKLEPQQIPLFHDSIPTTEFSEIPPLPDLSDLKTCREQIITTAFDTFTPVNTSKHQFNLRRKASIPMFVKPQPKSLITPLHQGDDFLKTLISCRVSTYDKPNSTHNMSTISQAANRINETIAECSTGFTKQQIQRLLSTKKGSSTKKVKFNANRPNIKVKKGGLFNETAENVLYRSHSSPNLYENKEKRSRLGGKQLSVMQEDITTLLEVSGISVIENNSGCAPENIIISLDSTKLESTPNQVPVIKISSDSVEKRLNYILKQTEEINKPKSEDSPILLEVSDISAIENNSGCQTQEVVKTDSKKTQIPRPYQPPVAKIATDSVERKLNNILKQTENIDITLSPSFTEKSQNFNASSSNTTPKTVNSIRRTSSIEKIINRFKKVRANVVLDKDDSTSIDTIQEEKENLNTVNVDVFTANKMLLPDLVSPNYSLVNKPSDFLDDLCFDIEEKTYRKPRESLGTALGVDQTILDQFDLID